MDAKDLELPGFYTTDGTDIWEMVGYFMQPSCTLRNLKTGKEEMFAMGALTAETFQRIDMTPYFKRKESPSGDISAWVLPNLKRKDKP